MNSVGSIIRSLRFFSVAIVGLGIASAPAAPALAGFISNGVHVNGLHANGIHVNGLNSNGIDRGSDDALNGVEVTSVTLRDGTTVRFGTSDTKNSLGR